MSTPLAPPLREKKNSFNSKKRRLLVGAVRSMSHPRRSWTKRDSCPTQINKAITVRA